MSDASAALHLGDCVAILAAMPDKSVDAIVTDPPYGNGTVYSGSYEDTRDNLVSLITMFMPQALRVAQCVAVTCGTGNIHLYPPPTWILCWATPAGTGRGPWGFCCWQPILVYGRDPYLAHGRGGRPDTIVHTEASPKNGHPCPKPIGFMRWLVERVTMSGATVLDPFMGSGTTGVAALSLGRKFVGIEREAQWLEIARIRLAETQPRGSSSQVDMLAEVCA